MIICHKRYTLLLNWHSTITRLSCFPSKSKRERYLLMVIIFRLPKGHGTKTTCNLSMRQKQSEESSHYKAVTERDHDDNLKCTDSKCPCAWMTTLYQTQSISTVEKKTKSIPALIVPYIALPCKQENLRKMQAILFSTTIYESCNNTTKATNNK